MKEGGRLFLLVACFLGGVFLIGKMAPVASAATFTVNSTVDDNDGTCTHPFVDASNDCTWREAINAANAGAGADTIVFAIDASFASDGDGQWTINLAPTATNALTGPTIVTGVSMWDVDDNRPGIKIARAAATQTTINFTSGATGSKVQGLEISGADTGIATTVSNVTIGTDCDGVNDGRERNVVYGSGSRAIFLGSSGAKVRGNYLGVLADGTTMSTFGSQAIRIIGTGGDSNLIGYEEGTSATCSLAVQRNIIGGGDAETDSGIFIASLAATNVNGDSATAPDHNTVAGNYIGVGADGVTDIGGLGSGVEIANAATLNIVGTDGDGVDDALEKNIISGWSADGVWVEATGNNRIAGNAIGFLPDGLSSRGNGSHGVLLRGSFNIVGWCNASMHATLCSNGGNKVNQANVIGFNGDTGVRVGASCSDCRVSGNIIGTDASGVVHAGNTTDGVLVHRGNTNVVIGGFLAISGNTIMFNGQEGVQIDGYFSGSPFVSGPTEGYVIGYNTIEQNGTGIHVLGTEQDGTLGAEDGTILNNTISNNTTFGLRLEGSSPDVTDNTITNNGTHGVEIAPAYRRDEPLASGTNYNNPFDALAPDNAANDSVAEPELTGNTIDGNGSGGIYMLDAKAANADGLEDQNTIGINGTFDVRLDWYAAVEVFDADGNQVTTGVESITLTPSHDLSCTASCSGNIFALSGNPTLGIWGPGGVQFNNGTTWFQLTDYERGVDGGINNYNPYLVSVTFTDADLGKAFATIDGNAADEIDRGFVPAGRTTAGLSRYQVAEVQSGRLPAGPPTSIGLIIAPEPVGAVALTSSSVRWYFSDNTNNERGFRIVRLDETGRETKLGEVREKDASFIDEQGLTAGETYCDRYVYAFNGDKKSDYVLLPCVTTLAEGQVASETGIALLTITQVAQLVDGTLLGTFTASTDNLMTSFFLFGGFLTTGWIRSERLRRKKCTNRHCWKAFSNYFGGGILAALALFIYLQTIYAPITLAEDVSPSSTVKQYDQIQFTFAVSNEGETLAEQVVLSDPFPEGLTIAKSGVSVFQNGAAFSDWALTLEDRNLEVSLGSLAAGEILEVKVVASVNVENDSLLNSASVKSSNAHSADSNTLAIEVQTPPPTLPVEFGTVVHLVDDPRLYYVDDDGTRRPFVNQETYDSWYPEGTETISLESDEMAMIPLGRPMLIRPGTWLLQGPFSETVYAVTPGNVLRPITSQTRLEQLYGKDWNSNVISVEENLFRLYTLGTPLSPFELPSAALLSHGEIICYINGSFCRPVTPGGMHSNHFSSRFVYEGNSSLIENLHQTDPIGWKEVQLVDPD